MMCVSAARTQTPLCFHGMLINELQKHVSCQNEKISL